MDTFLIAFKTVLPLFLVIVAGMIFSRAKVNLENRIEVLNKYALWIGFPALVIFSLMKLNLAENSYTSFILNIETNRLKSHHYSCRYTTWRNPIRSFCSI